ncbi:MAG: trehalose-phosphatase, partial [Tunicatimonas sp.]|uniref:trehalose-phosphatase n=1 Tax=Tunicatimonas sp. TaxID=1940096 RepID=UPI003C74FE67
GLVKEEKNKVVVISGRDKDTLGGWMGEFNVTLIAEHGIWMREVSEDWRTVVPIKGDWKKEIMPILEMYVQRTPGSFIEEKDFSLVWHYRKVETGLGELRTRELASHLKYISSNSNLQVLEGDHVVEIKDREVNKGRTAQQWLNQTSHDFVFAIGDDATDEDTFKVMPENAYTIKVGSKTSAARFNVNSFKDVRALLKVMIAEG